MTTRAASRRRWPAFAVTAALALAAALLAPATAALAESPSPATSAAGSTTLRIGISQKWSTLNPFIALLGADYEITSLNYDLLVEIGPDMKPAPGLAESWSHSADGLTWTFKIRQGATWHDGKPVTAEDVAFSYNYVLDSFTYKDGAFGLNLLRDYLAGVASVTAPDAQTVVITTEKPSATILSAAIPILPKHIWGDVTYEAASGASKDVKAFDNASMVGSGPFHLVEEVKDQYVRFEANKSFWGGAPKIDQLILQYFPDSGPMVEALKNGQIDMIDEVPTTGFTALQNAPGITTVKGAPIGLSELGLNSWVPQPGQTRADPAKGSLGNPWLTRVDVRQALFHAVDKAAIVKTALLDFGLPGDSIMAPSMAGHWSPSPQEAFDFDPAKTRSMLEALGFKDTDGNGVLNAPADATTFDPKGAGKDFVLRLYVRKNQPQDLTAGQLLKGTFEQAGVGIDLQVVEESPFLANATFPSATNADSDLYIWGWVGAFGPDPDFTLGRIAESSQISAWQDANYSDPRYDALYAQQHAELDPDKRAALVTEMQKLFYTEGSYAVLWYPYRLQAYRSDRWDGLKTMPAEGGVVFTSLAYGPYSTLVSVAPKGTEPAASGAPNATPATPSTGGSEGAGTTVLIGAVVVIALVVGGVVIYRRRTRPEFDD